MIIQCVGCGQSKFLDPKGTAVELESRVNATIAEGWRYSTNYKGYVCPKCCVTGIEDGFFASFAEPIKKKSKTGSYENLLGDFIRFIECV